MLCRTCHHRQAAIGRADCPRCAALVSHLFGAITDAVREIASVKISGGDTPTIAERSAQQVVVKWDVVEAARAIKRTLSNGETEALLTLPGSCEFSSAELDDLARRLRCSVTRGTEVDTILVTGYEGGDAA